MLQITLNDEMLSRLVQETASVFTAEEDLQDRLMKCSDYDRRYYRELLQQTQQQKTGFLRALRYALGTTGYDIIFQDTLLREKLSVEEENTEHLITEQQAEQLSTEFESEMIESSVLNADMLRITEEMMRTYNLNVDRDNRVDFIVQHLGPFVTSNDIFVDGDSVRVSLMWPTTLYSDFENHWRSYYGTAMLLSFLAIEDLEFTHFTDTAGEFRRTFTLYMPTNGPTNERLWNLDTHHSAIRRARLRDLQAQDLYPSVYDRLQILDHDVLLTVPINNYERVTDDFRTLRDELSHVTHRAYLETVSDTERTYHFRLPSDAGYSYDMFELYRRIYEYVPF